LKISTSLNDTARKSILNEENPSSYWNWTTIK
jgi:hypothetical protein